MDSFPDTSQGDTSFSLQEKEDVLLYLKGIQVCFRRSVCFFPAVGHLLCLNGKEVIEAQYSYVWPVLARSEPTGFYEVLIHGQL